MSLDGMSTLPRVHCIAVGAAHRQLCAIAQVLRRAEQVRLIRGALSLLETNLY